MVTKKKHIQIKKLMLQYSKTLQRLKVECVAKTRNSPVGDYTEWLVKEAFRGDLKGKSTKGYDMVVRKEEGRCIKYQIKGRWLDPEKPNTRLSIIRATAIKDKLFDFLIGVLFTNEFEIKGAWKIPPHLIASVNGERRYAHWSKSQGGGWLVSLQGDLLEDDAVTDITECLKFGHQDVSCAKCSE